MLYADGGRLTFRYRFSLKVRMYTPVSRTAKFRDSSRSSVSENWSVPGRFSFGFGSPVAGTVELRKSDPFGSRLTSPGS